jgi:hypothetical protein
VTHDGPGEIATGNGGRSKAGLVQPDDIAVAFSQNVRSAWMTRGRAVGNATPSTRSAASQAMSRKLAGYPVERAPNSSMTIGATQPDPFMVASWSLHGR